MSPPPWTRLIRFIAKDQPSNRIFLGEPLDANIDVGLELYKGRKVLARKIEGSVFDGKVGEEILEVKELLSPLGVEEVGTIRCLGLNYKDHAKEAKLPLPTIPMLFVKPRYALNSPFPAVVPIPKITQAEPQTDYEGELVIVMARDAKNVEEKDVLEGGYVLGYTASNDVSQRKWQSATSQWTHSKGFDGSCPIGPVLVSAGSIDPHNLTIKTRLNGKTMQDGNTQNLVFNIPQIISFLSQGTTVEKGSIIMTGTPAGVGGFYDPPVTVKEGDLLEIEIGGGIGTLINEFVSECDDPRAQALARPGKLRVDPPPSYPRFPLPRSKY